MGDIFTLLLVQPITNVLVAIYQGLIYLHVPYALGFSIILLTVVIRLLLYPLMGAQLRSMKKMQLLNPKLAELKTLYKKNPQRLQAETMLLYKEHGINPAAGCLPLIVQLPLIWGLYSVLQHAVSQTKLADVNHLVYSESLKLSKMWDTQFFGLPLGQTPGKLIATVGVGILLIPILTGVSQFIQTKMTTPKPAPKNDSDKKTAGQPDFATAFQTQSLYIFPFMIGFFSFTFPVGLSLYWITFTVFGIIQQYLMQKEKQFAPVTEPAISASTKKSKTKKAKSVDAVIVKTPKKKTKSK